MAAKLTRLTLKIAVQLQLVAEIYHLQFSLQAPSSETWMHPRMQQPSLTWIEVSPLYKIDKLIDLYQ
jgi:hypothetical protein